MQIRGLCDEFMCENMGNDSPVKKAILDLLEATDFVEGESQSEEFWCKLEREVEKEKDDYGFITPIMRGL